MAQVMADEETRLAQRSVLLGIKRRKKLLSDCVEARPDLLEPVIRHYHSLMGGAPASSAAAGGEPSGGAALVTPPGAPRRARSKRNLCTPEPPALHDKGGSGLEAELENVMNEGGSPEAASEEQEVVAGKQWSQLNGEQLMAVLIAAEPVSLSFANLRQGLGTSRSKYVHKNKLLEVTEYICGDKPSDIVQVQTMAELKTSFAEYNHLAARPAQNLVLPPDWPRIGVYELGQRDGALVAVNRITSESVVVQSRALRGMELQTLKVDCNYSTSGAYISCGKRRLCELNTQFGNDKRLRYGLWLAEGKGGIALGSPVRTRRTSMEAPYSESYY
mmetsp:Transcript_7057/g.9837  ORF Transcript_7057/g.9837 Transcript_7057/m.9837 type:complete len:331 (-) Transcript_7057:11-1003(-)